MTGAPATAAGALIERCSKTAALASVALIVVLQLALHPGMTMSLRILTAVSLAAGWLAGRSAVPVFAGLAPLAPAPIAAMAGFSDPVHHTVWMAGLAGSLLRENTWRRWDLPASWRVLLGGWALTLSLGWPVLVAREIGFDPRGVFDTGSVNSWAFLTTPQVVGWILLVVFVQLAGLLWLEWLTRRAQAGEGFAALRPVAHALWIGATVSSAVAIYQGTVDPTFLNNALYASLGRAAGLMLDANAYGVVAALAGPLAVIAIAPLGVRHGPLLAATVFAVNWIGVWMSGSRTALVCAMIGTAALGLALVRARRPPRAVLASMAGSLAAVAAIVALLSTATGPWRRVQELASGGTAGAAQALWGRGGYGGVAHQMIREYPLTGVGVGTYHWLAPDYWRLAVNDRLPFDNAQNWWRHQVAELGILGALPVLVWSVLVAVLLVSRASPRAHVDVVTVRGLVLGVGLISLVGMPTENPVALIWFFFLVALLATMTEVSEGTAWLRPRRAAWLLVAALAFSYAGAQLLLATGTLSVEERALRGRRDYASGVYAAEPLPDGGEFRWTRQDADLLLMPQAPWLVVRAWVAHPDVTERPVTLRLATPCQIVLERELRDAGRISVGLVLPVDYGPVWLSAHVSRTWSPSDYGSGDRRALGAALVTAFDREAALQSDHVVELRPCGT